MIEYGHINSVDSAADMPSDDVSDDVSSNVSDVASEASSNVSEDVSSITASAASTKTAESSYYVRCVEYNVSFAADKIIQLSNVSLLSLRSVCGDAAATHDTSPRGHPTWRAPSSSDAWAPRVRIDPREALLPVEGYHAGLAGRARARGWADASHVVLAVDVANAAPQAVDVAVAIDEGAEGEEGESVVQVGMQIRPQGCQRYEDTYANCKLNFG